MALQGSGQIKISQIRNEMVNVNSSYSLRSLSASAGKGTPDSMSEFYGVQGPVNVNVTACQYNDGTWWSPCPGYGGWHVDHWIYLSYWGDTITYGNECRTYTALSGTQISIYSSLRNIGYDNYCGKTYYTYVCLNGNQVATTAVGQGGDGDAVYTFTLQPGQTYNFVCGIYSSDGYGLACAY